MTKDGSKTKYFKIKIDFETGLVAKIKSENPNTNPAKKLTQTEIKELLGGPHTEVGQLVFTRSSPGCVTYILGGFAVQICY
jgi:hypothetical protein